MFSVLPKDYFGFLINQECKQAERYSNYFGLVRFSFNHLDFEASVWMGFPNVIKRATRDTDIIGVLQEKTVGLLMHNVDVLDLPKIVGRIQPMIRDFIRDGQIEGQLTIGGVCFPTHANTAKGLETAVNSNNF